MAREYTLTVETSENTREVSEGVVMIYSAAAHAPACSGVTPRGAPITLIRAIATLGYGSDRHLGVSADHPPLPIGKSRGLRGGRGWPYSDDATIRSPLTPTSYNR